MVGFQATEWCVCSPRRIGMGRRRAPADNLPPEVRRPSVTRWIALKVCDHNNAPQCIDTDFDDPWPCRIRQMELLPAEERGVSVSYGMSDELGLLLTVSWGSAIVLIESQLEAYKLDISKVDGEEIVHAKELLRKMMDDGRGDFIDA